MAGEVRVAGPRGVILGELFIFTGWRKQQLVEVKGIDTGRTYIVHQSRILRDKEGTGMATKKTSVALFDFKSVKGERWSKKMAFDHKGVKAEAHVIVNRVTKTYFSFNTYNGSLGKTGAKLEPKKFKYADYGQLTSRLLARGYRQVGTVVKVGKPAAKPKPKPGPVIVIPKVKMPAALKEVPDAVPAQPPAPPAPPAQPQP